MGIRQREESRLNMWISLIVFTAIAFSSVNGCGETLNARIIDGEVASRGDIPWQVRLESTEPSWNSQHWFCGGTIICPRYVISAAHCLMGDWRKNETYLKVLVSEHDTSNPDDHVLHNVQRIIPHPEFFYTEKDGIEYDFVILELEKPIDLSGNSTARAACLPEEQDDSWTEETQFEISGWGDTNNHFGGVYPDKLLKATITWVPGTECNHFWKKYYQNTVYASYPLEEIMLCAGGVEGDQGVCLGDSGGPLTWFDQDKSVTKLIGVPTLVHGFGCVDHAPNLFAKITSVLAWINKETGYCQVAP